MSSDNVELVRSIYAAWLAGTSARGFIDPEIEYVNPPDAVESGTRRGPPEWIYVKYRLLFSVYPGLFVQSWHLNFQSVCHSHPIITIGFIKMLNLAYLDLSGGQVSSNVQCYL